MSQDNMSQDSGILTVAEAAKFLRVGKKSFTKAIARGDIKGVRRVGNVIRVSKSALLQWMAEGRGDLFETMNIDVILSDWGPQKITVIKAIREITGLALKEAKDLVDSAPSMVMSNVPKDVAIRVKTVLRSAGAGVDMVATGYGILERSEPFKDRKISADSQCCRPEDRNH